LKLETDLRLVNAERMAHRAKRKKAERMNNAYRQNFFFSQSTRLLPECLAF